MRSLLDVPVIERLLARRSIDGRGCWLWMGSAPRYGYLWVRGRMRPVHRLAAAHFFGIDEADPDVNVLHSCDVPVCFNPEHLFLGTQRENMLDASVKGRLGHPAWNKGRSKADPYEVAQMYRAGGVSMREVGERFGVNAATVHRIIHAS